MNDPKKPKRTYRRVTAATVAKFQAGVIAHGNGSAAVRALENNYHDERRRAWLINSKSKQLNATEYVDFQLQRTAVEAIERVRVMVQSADEKIATKNSHYVIDHVRGKPLQRSESKNLNLNIEAVLG